MRHSRSSDGAGLVAGIALAIVVAVALAAAVGLLLLLREAFRVHWANVRTGRGLHMKRALLLLLSGCGLGVLLGLAIAPPLGALVASLSFLGYCVAIEAMDCSRGNPLAVHGSLLAPWLPGKSRAA